VSQCCSLQKLQTRGQVMLFARSRTFARLPCCCRSFSCRPAFDTVQITDPAVASRRADKGGDLLGRFLDGKSPTQTDYVWNSVLLGLAVTDNFESNQDKVGVHAEGSVATLPMFSSVLATSEAYHHFRLPPGSRRGGGIAPRSSSVRNQVVPHP